MIRVSKAAKLSYSICKGSIQERKNLADKMLCEFIAKTKSEMTDGTTTIGRVKENIISTMDEINKIDESNINNNKHIEISENDSLNQLEQKKKLLDEMIYLQNLKKMEQDFSHQAYGEDKNLAGKRKQLKLIKNNNEI